MKIQTKNSKLLKQFSKYKSKIHKLRLRNTPWLEIERHIRVDSGDPKSISSSTLRRYYNEYIATQDKPSPEVDNASFINKIEAVFKEKPVSMNDLAGDLSHESFLEAIRKSKEEQTTNTKDIPADAYHTYVAEQASTPQEPQGNEDSEELVCMVEPEEDLVEYSEDLISYHELAQTQILLHKWAEYPHDHELPLELRMQLLLLFNENMIKEMSIIKQQKYKK